MKKIILSILAISYLSAEIPNSVGRNVPSSVGEQVSKSTDAPSSVGNQIAKSTDAPSSVGDQIAKSTDAPSSVRPNGIQLTEKENALIMRKLRYFDVINDFTRCIREAKTQEDLDTCEDQVRDTKD